jgi:hypothetical protein
MFTTLTSGNRRSMIFQHSKVFAAFFDLAKVVQCSRTVFQKLAQGV